MNRLQRVYHLSQRALARRIGLGSLPTAVLLMSCARHAASAAASAPAAVTTRCSAIADSVLANVPREQLGGARPIGLIPFPKTPADVRAGMVLRWTAVVAPNGRSDTASVEVIGTSDHRYRQELVRKLVRFRFTPHQVDDCPVWSYFWVNIQPTGIIIRR